jgi:hypothetical protein
MLTRHFYELEEVCFALQDCLRYNKSEEAVFWARELVLSYEDDALTKTMIQAWIMYMGAEKIDWLDAWFQLNLEDDKGGCQRLVLVAEFCDRSPCDRSVVKPLSLVKTFWIACRGLSPVANEERVAQALAENDPICLYWWLGPTYEKKPTALMTAVANFVDSPELFDSLNRAMACKLSVQLRMLLSVCAVQLLCLDSYPDALVVTKGPFVAELLGRDDWFVGGRKSRLFQIKAMQLPRGYKRVLQADALCESAVKVMEMGCKFWQNVGALIQDDDTLESVVSEYFPDDIPDEWSVQDRAQSHPVALDVYKVQMKPDYRVKVVWGLKKHVPIFLKSWYPAIKLLFKACGVPDRS